MRVFDRDKVSVLWGEDLNDVGAYLANTPRRWRQCSSVMNPARYDWDLGAGWEGSLKLAQQGWTEGAVDLSNRLATLPPNMVEAEWVYDVAGGSPDVGLFVSGDPACMRDFGHPQGRKPTVHLVLNGWCSCGVTANEFRNYGTAILALVDMMENNGRSVELDVIFAGNQSQGWKSMVGWNVKHSGDSADLSAIAFSLAHPASFRRIGFAMMERTNPIISMPGYGMTATFTPDMAALVDLQDAFLLGGIGQAKGLCTTPESALRFAANEVNKAAGETLVELL